MSLPDNRRRVGAVELLAILVAASVRASFHPFRQFLAQASIMLANNLIFFVVWVLFFQAFDDIGGWRLTDVALLYGLVALAHGIVAVAFGSVRKIGQRINGGELDILMTEPPHILSQLVAQESNPMGWGDIGTGITMLVFFAELAFADIPLVLFSTVASVIVMTSALIAFNSLTFWSPALDGLNRMYFEFLLTFSMYPGSIFTGAVRFLMFTVVPAGFIGLMPVSLLRDPGWLPAAAIAGGAIGFATLALTLFNRGLARYTSGSGFVSRRS